MSLLIRMKTELFLLCFRTTETFSQLWDRKTAAHCLLWVSSGCWHLNSTRRWKNYRSLELGAWGCFDRFPEGLPSLIWFLRWPLQEQITAEWLRRPPQGQRLRRPPQGQSGVYSCELLSHCPPSPSSQPVLVYLEGRGKPPAKRSTKVTSALTWKHLRSFPTTWIQSI